MCEVLRRGCFSIPVLCFDWGIFFNKTDLRWTKYCWWKQLLHRLECLKPSTPGIELRNVYIYILLYTGYIWYIFIYKHDKCTLLCIYDVIRIMIYIPSRHGILPDRPWSYGWKGCPTAGNQGSAAGGCEADSDIHEWNLSLESTKSSEIRYERFMRIFWWIFFCKPSMCLLEVELFLWNLIQHHRRSSDSQQKSW